VWSSDVHLYVALLSAEAMKRKADDLEISIHGKQRARELCPVGLYWRTAQKPYTNYEVADAISPIYKDRGIVRCKARPKYLILQANHEGGYKLVSIQNDSGEAKRPLVHQLTVIGDQPSPTHTVDHIKVGREFRAHNFCTDLRWLTKKGQVNNRKVPTAFMGARRSITRTHVESGVVTVHNGWKESLSGVEIPCDFNTALTCIKTSIHTGKERYGYKFTHTESEQVFKPIPPSFIGGAEGYEASEKGGWIKKPDGFYNQGCFKG
jgi:hypothetical protein